MKNSKDNRFTFRPVIESQHELIHEWLKQDYIQKWIHGPGLQSTLSGLIKFTRYYSKTHKIERTSHLTQHWIGYEDEHPFVYLLTSNVLKDEASEYAKYREIDGLAITLDIFICDRNYLGKGLATQIIQEFLRGHFSDISEVFIDPEYENKKAVHVYQKIGFKIVGDFIASWHPVPHYIMKLDMKKLIAVDNFKIETDRLLMRPFNENDIKPFSRICANPKVMRYIGNGKPLEKEIVKTQIQGWMSLYEKQGYGLLALTLKENDQLIGFCGLIHQTVDEENFIELGYRVDEKFWGKGIATEAALAVKNYALNQLNIPVLISIIHHQNEASKKVALKAGMKLKKKTQFKGVLVDIFSSANQCSP